MANLTIKKVPDRLLELLKDDAERERRSLNQHALWLLERALSERSKESDFAGALGRFRERNAAELSDALEVPRDRSPGRRVEP
jgi:hypothetical protein